MNPNATAAMAGPFGLVALTDELENRVRAAFDGFRLAAEVPSDPPLAVTVYSGSVKSRSRTVEGTEDAPQFPFVLIRPPSHSDDTDGGGSQKSLATVDFVFAVRRIGKEGQRDVLSMIDRLRIDLLRTPKIGVGADLELPLSSDVGEDDAFPQWFGIMTASFVIPQPIVEAEGI